MALFYLYHKLPLISAGLIQRCITEKALLTLGQKSGTHYQTKKKGERSIGAFKDRLDFLCLSIEVKFFKSTVYRRSFPWLIVRKVGLMSNLNLPLA